MAARNSLQVGLVVLALLCLHSTHCQVTVLVQVNPPEGDPVCWNSPLTFNCTVKAAQLIWGYPGMGVEPVAFFADDTSGIGQPLSLGPFNVTLLSAVTQNETAVMISAATITTEITDAIDEQSISCQGTQEELITISITELQIDNAAFCNSTVSWSPPPCDANCTISVDGQDTGPVPCMNGRLDTSFSTLITRAVMLTAVDGVGRSTTTEVSVDSSADCIKVPPVTLVSPSSGTCEDSEHLTYMVEDASLVYTIVDVESGDTIHLNISVSEPTFSFEAKCGRRYELQVNNGLVIADIEAKSCRGFYTCVILPVVLPSIVLMVLGVIFAVFICKCWLKKGSEHGNAWGVLFEKKSEHVDDHESPFKITEKKSYGDHEHPITHCAVSSDGKYIASVDDHAVLRIWKDGSEQSQTVDVQNMQIIEKPKSNPGNTHAEKVLEKTVGKAKYSKDGNMERLVSLSWVDGTIGRQLMLAYNTVVMIYDMTRSAVSIVLLKNGTDSRIFCAACSPSDETFAASFTKNLDKDDVVGKVVLGRIDLSSEQKHVELAGSKTPVLCMSFSQSGRFLAGGNLDGSIEIYDRKDPTQKLHLWALHEGLVCNLHFDINDETKVYSLGEDNTLRLLDVSKENKNGKKLAKYDEHQESLFHQELYYATSFKRWRKPPRVFQYPCRSQVFVVGFENKYILNALQSGGMIYEVYGDFQLKKVQALCDDQAVTCVDWVTTAQDDITTCVMGCFNGSVKIVKFECKKKPQRRVTPSATNRLVLEPAPEERDHRQNMTAKVTAPQKNMEHRPLPQDASKSAKSVDSPSQARENLASGDNMGESKDLQLRGGDRIPLLRSEQGREKGTAATAAATLPPEEVKDATKEIEKKTSTKLTIDEQKLVCENVTFPITHCKISPHAKYVAIAGPEGIVRVLNCDSWKVVKNYQGTSCIVSLEWLDCYDDIALMIGNRITLEIVHSETNQIFGMVNCHWFHQDSRILCAAHSTKGSTFALSCLLPRKKTDADKSVGHLVIGDVKKETEHCSLRVASPVSCMVLDRNGKRLITGNMEGKLIIYDVGVEDNHYTATSRCEWPTPHGIVYNLQYSNDDKQVYSIGKSDQFLLQSKLSSLPPKTATFKIRPGAVSTVESIDETLPVCGQLFCFIPKKGYLLTSSSYQGIIYKLKDGKSAVEKLTFPSHDANITCVDVRQGEDRKFVCVLGYDSNAVYVMKMHMKG